MDEIKAIRFPDEPRGEEVYEEDKEDRAKAREAAKLIGQSFVWGYSVEGDDFWHRVHARLCQIADNGRLK